MSRLMPQPWKHPKLGTYYYRKVVPERLRRAVGLTEIRISLDTSSVAEAKLKYPDAASQADAILAKANGGSRTAAPRESMSVIEIERLSATYLHHLLSEDEEARVDGLDLDRPAPITESGYEQMAESHVIVAPHYRAALSRGDWTAVEDEVDELLDQNDIALNKGSDAYKRLSLAILKTTVTAHQLMLKRHEGDVVETPAAPAANLPAGKSGPAPVKELFDAWARERSFAPKTRDMWEKIVGKLMAHVGHDDVARVADTDIIAWKDGMVAAGLAPKTISNNLTTAKTFFRWAASNKKIATNPATHVEYKVKRDPKKRKLSYSDDEAKRILAASRKEKDPLKRWAPWLCAFTGPRIDEVCGAMAADVQHKGSIHFIRIDPANREEGASVKNEASIRSMPLHAVVIADGFLKYVAKLPKDGPLFPGIKPDRYGKRGGNGQKTLARWIRNKIGITNPRIQPTNAWRHRFEDECRKLGIMDDLRDAIAGRTAPGVGRRYGDKGYPLEVMAEAVAKIKSPV